MQRYDYILYAAAVFAWGTSWFAMHLQVGVVAPEELLPESAEKKDLAA